MGNLLAKKIRLSAKNFNLSRKLHGTLDEKVTFLKRDGRIQPFENLREFTIDFDCVEDRFRNRLDVFIAVVEDLSALVGKTTHIAYRGQVYAIEGGDRVPPMRDSPFWRLSVEQTKDVYQQ